MLRYTSRQVEKKKFGDLPVHWCFTVSIDATLTRSKKSERDAIDKASECKIICLRGKVRTQPEFAKLQEVLNSHRA